MAASESTSDSAKIHDQFVAHQPSHALFSNVSDSSLEVNDGTDALPTRSATSGSVKSIHGRQPEPVAWSVAQTARALGLSIDTTYKLIRAGRIPARRVGGRLLVPARRLTTWINDDIRDPFDTGPDAA